jgi:uncharacterized surface protein with fasciclin (FAS1) repeats
MTNVIDIIEAEGTLTAFARALKMSRLAIPMREPGAYTVFAPNDAAFAQMNDELRANVFNEYYNLSRVVKLHVVKGIYEATDLLDVIFLKTMEGQRLVVRSSVLHEVTNKRLDNASYAHNYVVKNTVTSTMLESIKVNGATIIRADGRANNGIVHVIDKVLIPLFMNV